MTTSPQKHHQDKEEQREPSPTDADADFHREDSASRSSCESHGDRRLHLPLYSPPQQIRRWGEAASHPHVDWGGLFYDLFYVAAAYNLGSLYISAIDDVNVQQDRPLLLYVIAAFGAIWMTWYNTVAYDARFSVLDYSHRILHILRIVAVSFSIVHIKSFDQFSDPRDTTLFFFLFGLLLESLINLLLWVEIRCVGRGGPEMKHEARFAVAVFILPQVIIYAVAAAIAGTNCFSSSADSGKDDAHRLLGEEKDTSAEPSVADDKPIWLVFGAYVLYQITAMLRSMYLGWKKLGEKYTVPVNVDFCVHRLGEWVMLMLGESVLSLLIVGLADEEQYYIIVLVGILTVAMLQDLHFESQPSDADANAMSTRRAGNFYVLLIQGYSLALIFLGASYKYMLDLLNLESVYDEKYDGGYNETDGGYNETDGGGSYHSRLLGGSIVNPEDVQKSKEYVVWMYCLSLVFVLLAMELMVLLHEGLPWKRWLSSDYWVKEPLKRVLQVFFLCLKIGLLVSFAFYATNSTLMTFEVAYVTFFGGAIVFLFLFMRIIDWEFLQSDSNKGRETNSIDPSE